jgi:hypothetical protein
LTIQLPTEPTQFKVTDEERCVNKPSSDIQITVLPFFTNNKYVNNKRGVTMKKRILALGCMAALLAFGSEAFAATGSASSTIGTAISISQSATNPFSPTSGDLAFGHIIPGAGGTVTITPAGVVTKTGAVTLTTQLTKGPAQFKVEGDAGKTYHVTLDETTTITAGTNTMNVTGLNHNSDLYLDGDGVAVFHVGGTLNVASAQTAGIYEGTFNISATYD